MLCFSAPWRDLYRTCTRAGDRRFSDASDFRHGAPIRERFRFATRRFLLQPPGARNGTGLCFVATVAFALTPSLAFADAKHPVAAHPATTAHSAVPAAHGAASAAHPAHGATPVLHGAPGARSAYGAHPAAHGVSGARSAYAEHPGVRGIRPGQVYKPRPGAYGAPRAAELHSEAFREHRAYEHAIYGHRRYDAWGWHHGVAWEPAPSYWGGGFWGPLALGVTFGAIVAVAVDSPGHVILENYGLVQVACDPNAQLVTLYGPNGSVVCATPDAMVAPGNYNIEPSTLELQPTTEE
jgi:hypothetical protein